MEEWYSVGASDFLENYGGSILSKYSGSSSKLIQSVFPGHDWDEEKWKVSKGYWDDIANQREFMEGLIVKLGLKDHQQWKSITSKMIIKNGGTGILKKYSGSPSKLIRSVFPEHDWN